MHEEPTCPPPRPADLAKAVEVDLPTPFFKSINYYSR
jgi:hypothetical protein